MKLAPIGKVQCQCGTMLSINLNSDATCGKCGQRWGYDGWNTYKLPFQKAPEANKVEATRS